MTPEEIAAADAALSPREQARVTIFRLVRRIYLRVESRVAGKQLDRLSEEEQQQILEPWMQAMVLDVRQINDVLDETVAFQVGVIHDRIANMPGMDGDLADQVAVYSDPNIEDPKVPGDPLR